MTRVSRAFRALTVLAAIAVPAAASGGAQALTMEEALARAYEANPELEAERAALRATDEGVPQALSGWRPQVSVSGSAGRSHVESKFNEVSSRTETDLSPRSISLDISQPLYRGGRTMAAVDRAKAQVQAARARLIAVEQSVLLRVATAFVNVVRDQAVVELNENNEDVLGRQLEAAQDRFRVGEVTRTDVSQAESRVERTRADRAAAVGDLENSRANFQRLVGADAAELNVADPLAGLPVSKDEAVELAARSNPGVVVAEFDRLATEHQVREVRGELLPTLSLDGSVERGDELTNPGGEREEMSIIARVTVPLYQQGAVYSRVREAKQVLQQAQSEVDNQRRVAVENATRSWENLVSSRAEIVARRAQVESAELALDGVGREQEVGSRTVLDVLDAEQELLDARVNLVRAERDLVVASYELKSAIGQLTAYDLGLAVTLYDFDEHYREVRNQWWGTEP